MTPEQQAELNKKIAEHDEQQKNSGNENQEFEIGQGN